MKVSVINTIYTHYANHTYSDFRGCLFSDGSYVRLNALPAFFKMNDVLNAVWTSTGLKHKRGTVRYYKRTEASLKADKRGLLTPASIEISQYKRRFCFKEIYDAYMLEMHRRIVALYGVRRTGKTVLMRQVEAELRSRGIKTAFLTCTPQMVMADVDAFLLKSLQRGITHVFIDEITFVSDFLIAGYYLGDVYAPKMHIMIAGTNSFQLRVASRDMLFDRITLFPMTYISYKEYHYLLGRDFDTFVKSGGLLCKDFKRYEDVHWYIDTAIIENFDSVFYDKHYSRKVQELSSLHETNSLTGYVNAVIENEAADTLSKTFESNRLNSALQILRKNGVNVSRDSLQTVISTFHYKIDLKKSVLTSDVVTKYILEYLYDIGVLYWDKYVRFISVPGLAYSLTFELLTSVWEGVKFGDLSLSQADYDMLCTKIEQDMYGVLMENIIYHDTVEAFKDTKYTVYKANSPTFEYDLVVVDDKRVAHICEIKHSNKRVIEQAKYLINSEDFERTNYPNVGYRTVIYTGKTINEVCDDKVIRYVNVCDYLLNIRKMFI